MLSAGRSRLAWLTSVGTLIFSLSRLRLGGSPRRLGGRTPVGVCSGGSLSPVAGPWSAHCARLGNMLPVGVWLLGVVALVAYAVSGCPCGRAWLVRLRGFPCVRVALFAGAACVLVCARMAFRVSCGGVCVLCALFRVGCFITLVAACPLGCLFVGCGVL